MGDVRALLRALDNHLPGNGRLLLCWKPCKLEFLLCSLGLRAIRYATTRHDQRGDEPRERGERGERTG